MMNEWLVQNEDGTWSNTANSLIPQDSATVRVLKEIAAMKGEES